MASQKRFPQIRGAATLAALYFVLHAGAVGAQDRIAWSASPGTAGTMLMPLPVAVAPTVDRSRQELFLRSAPIDAVRRVKIGVTGTQRAALSAPGLVHDASIQTVDEFKARFESATRVELHFRDYWGYNVAAYRLGVLLGLDNIPVSVERRFRGQPAAFTWWVDDVLLDERARVERQVKPPDPAAWTAQIHVMRVFDELVANSDRNQGNMLIDRAWRLWLIDHSRAFRLARTLRTPAVLRRCDRTLLARLKTLTRETIDDQLAVYLTSMERDALMARRDALVAHFDSLGQAALYDQHVSRR